MAFLSRNSRVGVSKSRPTGLPGLWSPITLRADLKLKSSLKQSYSSCRELSNNMWHVICSQINRVDSWLFLVMSQNGSLTLDLSFGHNLCFRCPNEQCKPILDICVPRAFQLYKERYKPLRFDASNCSLKFWESTGTPSPKVGVALGVWGFTPSHFLALLGVGDVTFDLLLGSHPYNPFCLGREPKARVATFTPSHSISYSQMPLVFLLTLGLLQLQSRKHRNRFQNPYQSRITSTLTPSPKCLSKSQRPYCMLLPIR